MVDYYLKHMELARNINKDRNEINPANQRCVALILYRKRIVSIGLNSSKTHPLIKKLGYKIDNRKYPLHAELSAWMDVEKRNQDFDTLFVYRGLDANLPSCPCSYCSKWITKLPITVVYNTEIGVSVTQASALIGHTQRTFKV